VPVTRLTVAGGDPFDDAAAAREWMGSVCSEPAARAAEVRSAMRLVNRALGALRAEAGDPLVQDVGATRALAIRIGFGDGEELADGRWVEARELPPPHRGRLEDVGPQSRVAAVLAGRDEVHPAETLLHRARLDAELGREAEARHGLQAARAALEEAPAGTDRIAAQIAELDRRLADKNSR
jgi:hypothetical protein